MQLRTVALTVLLTGVTVFVARLAAPRSAAHAPVPALAPKLRELEVRLLEHRTDSIVGADGRTRQPVRLAFPSGRPVVALLYESTCPACQLAESGWADMARRVGESRADCRGHQGRTNGSGLSRWIACPQSENGHDQLPTCLWRLGGRSDHSGHFRAGACLLGSVWAARFGGDRVTRRAPGDVAVI